MISTMRYPMMAAAIARAMPVLPEVASISVSPGRMSPRSSASRIIDSAGRSLTEPAGLLPSSLSRMVLPVSPVMRCSRTSGVLPTQSAMVGNSVFIVHPSTGTTGTELPPASFSIYDNGNRKRDANIEHACDETSAGHGHQGPPAADDAVADCTDGAGDGRLFQLAAAARDRTAAAPARVDDR